MFQFKANVTIQINVVTIATQYLSIHPNPYPSPNGFVKRNANNFRLGKGNHNILPIRPGKYTIVKKPA